MNDLNHTYTTYRIQTKVKTGFALSDFDDSKNLLQISKVLWILLLIAKELIINTLRKKTCTTTVNCGISQEKETGLFVIDQEIEEISQSYE